MAGALKSYVEKYLLNPAASFNVDNEGNEETQAQIVEDLADDERATANQQSKGKLRARNAAILPETDPRYVGKKVSRKDLIKDVSYDPELTSYFVQGEDEDEEDDDDEEEGGDDMEDAGEDEESEDEIEDKAKVSPVKVKGKSFKRAAESGSDDDDDGDDSDKEDEDEEDEEETDDDEVTQKMRHLLESEGKGFSFNGDFSKFAEDMEEDSDEEESEEEEGNEEEEEGEEDDNEDEFPIKSKQTTAASIKKFSIANESEEIQKCRAVKDQLGVYDSLFEIRIGMQKLVSGANQLPQFDTYKEFVKQRDPNYIKNLTTAKATAKRLLSTLLEAQEALLNQNPETRYIVSGKNKPSGGESNEEITSSEDEMQEEVHPQKKGTKRKLKLEEYEDILSKRHAAMIPFRDETITRWYEKTKLLSNRGRDKFSGFEVSALQQLKNVLNNKQQLIRRTQLTGVTRGTSYHILGRNDENAAEADKEHDPEIFDDSDFYSRTLEEMLKSKISFSNDMADVSQKWIEIQKLRKKAKKRTETKGSKGRKLRYEVITKLQQYLAPCNPSQMDDAAMNTLFSSLFGKSIHVNTTTDNVQ